MSRARDIANTITSPEFSGNVEVIGTSPELTFETTNASHYNFQIAVQENIDGGLEISSGAADADSSNDTFTPRIVVMNDGDVGIGTNSPSSYYATDLVVNSSDEGGVTIVNSNSHQGYLMFADGTSGGERYRGYIGYDHNGDIMQMTSGGYIKFLTNDTSEAMRIDSSGNVGIGATPATWNSGNTALQIGGNGTLHGSTAVGASKFVALTQNAHIDSDGSWEYISTDEASNYYQDGGAHYFRTAASGSAGADITWTDALKIDSSGNFMVGKTALNGATTGIQMAKSNGQTIITQATVTNDACLYINQIGEGGNNDSDQGVVITVDGTNAASGSGNVLRCVGTNSTHGAYEDLLTVKNNATVFMNTTLTFGGTLNLYHGGIGMGEGSSSGEYRRMYWNTSNDDLRFWNGSNEGSINSSGAWTDASDVSLKKDISDITYGINTIKALKPRKYKMKLDNKEQVGFIAQEMETQIPEIVTAGTNPNGEEHKGIAYGQLTAVLTKALQEAIEKIETLEAKVATLEGS